MNKQELIESIIYLPSDCSQLRPMIDKLTTLELIKLLDEPEKVKIPQFVADIVEEYKERNAPIIDIFTEKNYNKKYDLWLATSLNAYDRAARAWLDGYEIEKPKYVVTDGNHLYFQKYQEDIEIVILSDEQPGTTAYVKKFDTKEEAQKAADILGWKVEELRNES